jgi:hypothetical protein
MDDMWRFVSKYVNIHNVEFISLFNIYLLLLSLICGIILSFIHRISQEERSIFWEVIVSVILSKNIYMYMCPVPNGFRDRANSLYSSLDLAPNIVLSSGMWIGVKHQLAVVTADSDNVGVLWKRRHISTIPNIVICCTLFSHELQSALMSPVEFPKMHYTR